MEYLDNVKYVWMVPSKALTDDGSPQGAYGGTSTTSVDTKGFDRADIIVQVGDTDIAMAEMSVYSGPAAASGANDSTYSEITGTAASGTTGDGRLPQADDDDTTFVYSLDLRKDSIDRFLAVNLVAGDGASGTRFVAVCVLSKAEESPSTADEAGIGWRIHA